MIEWDPNHWEEAPPCRIYGDDRAELFALVDAIDYQWAIQWLWSPKWSRGSRKVYLRRNVHTGSRLVRTQQTLFLHIAIMRRKGDVPPSLFHTIVDHIDGDGLNCRRGNLRWATPSENRINQPNRKIKEKLT